MAKPIVHGVKERPILFSGPMIRALLDGSKTQTRRVIAMPPGWDCIVYADYGDGWWPFRSDDGESSNYDNNVIPLKCPYGYVGDRLWVREPWQALHKYNSAKISDIPEVDRHWVNYPAGGNTWDARQRAARFMPRWASRILLEIVSVRVERLQDISQEDARAEGIVDGGCTNCGNSSHPAPCGCDNPSPDWADGFFGLWQSINGNESLIANPWVWVVEFKRVAA